MLAIRPHIAAAIAASTLLTAGTARAANPDLAIDYSKIVLHASGPGGFDTGNVQVPMLWNTGFTAQNPFVVSCDSTEFSGGLQWTYVNNATPVYPELTLYFYLNGDEKNKIESHGYTNTVPGGFTYRNAPDNSILQHPGDTLQMGYIPWTQSVPFWQWGFQATDLPANQLVKMHVVIRGFSCDTWDPVEGGYPLACLVPDAVPWNNAVNIWIKRVC